MDLATFVLRLQDSGRVAVARAHPPELGAIAEVLRACDAAERLDGPAGLPELDVAAATWGALQLHAGCAAFVHRDVDAATLHAWLAAPCPSSKRDPATHYAVDLVLRHLPELLSLARGLAPADPLLAALRTLGTAWPLPSVGVAGLGPLDVRPLLAHPAMRLRYVDRVVRLRDRSRTEEPAVARAIAAALGEHTELAAEVAAELGAGAVA
jgi:hypothetical protein